MFDSPRGLPEASMGSYVEIDRLELYTPGGQLFGTPFALPNHPKFSPELFEFGTQFYLRET